MDFRKLNEQLKKFVEKEIENKKFIQFGSFHENPESIYFNVNPKLKNSFNDRDFDNVDTVYLKKGALVFLEADDESINVWETAYKTKESFIKALKDSYSQAKRDYDENEVVEIGTGSSLEPDVWNYFGGYVIEEEEDMESSETFCKTLINWFNNTYIDKDSGSVYCLLEAKTMKKVLGGNIDLYEYDPEDFGSDVKKKEVETDRTFADWFGDLTGQIYDGDIDCIGCRLISLKGAPKIVTGDFNCYGNHLTTLEGAPQKVGGNFCCGLNKLTTLEGAPQKVGGYFICCQNKLTTLEGAPQTIERDFDCNGNNLTSLKGAPSYVGGDFNCYYNKQLTSLEGAPKIVGGDFNCQDTKLKSTDGIGKVKGMIYKDFD